MLDYDLIESSERSGSHVGGSGRRELCNKTGVSGRLTRPESVQLYSLMTYNEKQRGMARRCSSWREDNPVRVASVALPPSASHSAHYFLYQYVPLSVPK